MTLVPVPTERTFRGGLLRSLLRSSGCGLFAGSLVSALVLLGVTEPTPAETWTVATLIAAPGVAIAWAARRLPTLQLITRIATATGISYAATWAGAIASIIAVLFYRSGILPAVAAALTCISVGICVFRRQARPGSVPSGSPQPEKPGI